MNLIFDIGGIIIDDSNRPLLQLLGMTTEQLAEFKQVVYHNDAWSEGVMLGYTTQEDYMRELAAKYPQYQSALERALSLDYQSQSVPRITDNMSAITKLKSRHQIYFLSNLTDATHAYLNDFLSQFDGGAYSFQEHRKKPEPDFYRILLERYQLNPSDSIFFDDRLRNVEVARQLGITAYHISTPESLPEILQRLDL